MQTAVRNAVFVTPAGEIRDQQLLIEDDRIRFFEPVKKAATGVNSIDAQGLLVIPGLIDIHVHGANGHDTMDATPEAIHGMARFFAHHGVTSYLPTTVTAASEATRAAIENVARTPQPDDGARHMGIHLEGPYLSHEQRGAQPPQHLRRATPDEYGPWLSNGQVRLMTVAPEAEGVLSLIDAGVSEGVEFALGHTAATYEQAREAADHGLRQATHVFNGMAPLHHRTPGAVGAALSDPRIRCQVIADGIHVHPAVISLLIKAKGTGGTILITDATRATGMPDGTYMLGDQEIHVREGVARTSSGGLAGSTLTMDQALRNAMQFTGLSLSEALPMATSTPAAAMNCNDRKGVIAPGADADLVLLDAGFQVRMTMVGGRVVFNTLH
jgi:N-acetylglucosamine-6-phosphate deacetylase